MGGKNTRFTLEVLLKLNDQLSGRLGRSTSALTKFEKRASATLKTYDQFSKGLSKPVSVSPLSKYDAKLKGITKNAAAALRIVTKLNQAMAGQSPARTPSAGRQLDRHVREFRVLERERAQAMRESERVALQAERQAERERRPAKPAGAVTPRRAPYRPGDWMKDSDYPPDWRRELRGQRPPAARARRRGVGRGEHMEGLDDALQTPGQIGRVWRERVDGLSTYTEETKRLLLAQERFKVVGLPDDANRLAFQTVRQTVGQIKGLSVADTTENMLDLVGALNDVNQAAKFMPLASKYRLGFDVLFGDQMTAGERNAQVLNSFKSLEYLGVTQRGPDETAKALDVIAQIGNATGGRVLPGEILTMLRRGKVASRGLTPEGLRNVSTLVEDMGAPTVGQSLMSLYQNIVGGRMPQYAAKLHQQYGLIEPGKIEYTKAGMLKRVMPGGHKLTGLLQEDPLKFADALTEHLRKGGVNVRDNNKLREVLTQMFPDRNAFSLVDALITQRPQVVKESGRAAQSKGAIATYGQVQGSELMRLKEYEAAWTNFKAEVGMPLLKMTADMAKGMRPVLELAAEYPKTAAGVLLLTKSFTGLAQTSSLLYRGGGGLREFLTGTRADAGGLTGELGRTAAGVGRLRGLVSSLPKVGAAMGVGFALEQLVELGMEIRRQHDLMDELQGKARQTWEEFVYRPLPGGGVPTRENVTAYQKDLQDIVLGGFKGTNEVGGLKRALGADSFFSLDNLARLGAGTGLGGIPAWVHHLKNPYAPRAPIADYDPEPARGVFRKTMPYLSNEPAMVEALRLLRSGRAGVPNEGVKAVEKTFQLEWPKAYQGAVDKLAKESTDLQGATAQNVEAMRSLLMPYADLGRSTTSLATSIYHVSSSLNEAAADILSWSPPAPGVSGPTVVGRQGGATSPGPRRTGNRIIDSFNPFGGFRERGGPVERGVSYVVGERGRELFTPAADGFITPLSRRTPGDWLEGLTSLVARMNVPGDRRTGGQPPGRPPFTFKVPTRETGSVVRKGGFIEVHDREANVPAEVTDRWRDDEFTGPADFSLFGGSAAAGDVYNYNLTINVPPGSRAADEPQAFARMVMQKIEELQRENVTLRAEVVRRTDPRRVERHIKHLIETEEERA